MRRELLDDNDLACIATSITFPPEHLNAESKINTFANFQKSHCQVSIS
jgi:hypothetical protein